MDSTTTLPPATDRRTAPALPPVAAEPARLHDTRPPLVRRPPVPRLPAPQEAAAEPLRTPPARRRPGAAEDPAQAFVSALRAAAPRFAVAAGTAVAVVAEVVPPARHRRARCRLMLLREDGSECAVVFAGAAGRPGTTDAEAFTDGIAGWLAAAAPLDPGAAPAHGAVLVDLAGGPTRS